MGDRAAAAIKDYLQIMMVTMLTFLEVRWVGLEGGLNNPITVNASDLWTKPLSSLYLKEKKNHHASTTAERESLC